MQTIDGQAKSRITSENSFSSKEYSRLDGQIAKLWGKRQVPYTTLTDLPRERINLSYSVQVNNFITQKCSFLQVVPMNSRWLDCFAGSPPCSASSFHVFLSHRIVHYWWSNVLSRQLMSNVSSAELLNGRSSPQAEVSRTSSRGICSI